MKCFQMRWTRHVMSLPESGKKQVTLLGEELGGALLSGLVRRGRKPVMSEPWCLNLAEGFF